MIGWLKGLIRDKQQPGKLVLDVNGVGYDVEISLMSFFQVEQATGPVELLIHTVVREDAFLLYGFINQEERSLFRALIKVNGVGPKLAMGILSSLEPQAFLRCIQQQDLALLVKLPGVGKKTAERLLVEMKGGLKELGTVAGLPQSFGTRAASASDEAVQALEALGYKSQEAQKAIQKIEQPELSCEQLIRRALQLLAPA